MARCHWPEAVDSVKVAVEKSVTIVTTVRKTGSHLAQEPNPSRSCPAGSPGRITTCVSRKKESDRPEGWGDRAAGGAEDEWQVHA